MPELGIIRNSHNEELACLPKAALLKRLGQSSEHEIIDFGRNSVVVNFDHPQEVAAISRNLKLAPWEAKWTFYIQRIFSNLFPDNFPHFYSVTGNMAGSKRLAGSVRERIYPGSEEVGEVDPILAKCRSFGLNPDLDTFSKNLMSGNNGNIYYVDTIPRAGLYIWNLDKIKGFMDQNSIEPVRQTRVINSLLRLRQLGLITFDCHEEVG